MKTVAIAVTAIALSALTGCQTGMQPVHDPHALVAPADQAVMVVVQPSNAYLSAVVLDGRGSCLGYTRSDSWFTVNLRPGERIIHVKHPDTVLSAKIDVAAGKTYFLEPRFKGSFIELHSINPDSPDWKTLDGMLKDGTQFKVDRKTCNSTLSEMTWMPGQDLKKLLKEGGAAAQGAPPMLKPDQGVTWQGSTAKSK